MSSYFCSPYQTRGTGGQAEIQRIFLSAEAYFSHKGWKNNQTPTFTPVRTLYTCFYDVVIDRRIVDPISL